MNTPQQELPNHYPVAVSADRRAPGNTESATAAALLADLATGDVAGFAAFYDSTCARVYGVALRVVRDPVLAQDVTEEVYRHLGATGAGSFDCAGGSIQAGLITVTGTNASPRAATGQP